MHGPSFFLTIQDTVRVVDLLYVIPTPVTFIYSNHCVILNDLLMMDLRRRRDYRGLNR